MFCLHGLDQFVPLEKKSLQISSTVFFLLITVIVLKHFYPGGRGLFPDDSSHIHRTQRLVEWFDNDINFFFFLKRCTRAHLISTNLIFI